MKFPKLKSVVVGVLALLAVGYVAIALLVASNDGAAPPRSTDSATLESIAIFGASGTAGDGILEAALADPTIERIKVITRRLTPRMELGTAAGKVEASVHLDYLDYAAIHDEISDVDAVFWAIGLSSIGVDEETYRRIHVDFPRQFVEEWLRVSTRSEISFHYISSSDISADSSAMWARVKVEAEDTLFGLANGTRLRVIAYRPDYIGPTAEEAHLGQTILYGFFAPLGAAVKARKIGQAMIEVALRGGEFTNGDKLGTWKIKQFSAAYEAAQDN